MTRKTARGKIKEITNTFEEKALKTKAIRESIKKTLRKEELEPNQEKTLIKIGEEITQAMQKGDQSKIEELTKLFKKIIQIRKEEQAKQERIPLKKPKKIVEDTINELKRIEEDFKLKLIDKKNKPNKESEKLSLYLLKKQSSLTKKEQEKWNKEAMKELKRLFKKKQKK